MAVEATLQSLHSTVSALAPVQLAVLGALAFVVAAFVGRVVYRNLPGKQPPILEGVPYIGGLLKFAGGPWKLMEEGYSTKGEVFTVPVAHKRVTFLIGPDVAPHFFKATDEELSQTEVYNFNVPTFGKGVVYDVDQKVRTEQFRFFTEALKKERLRKYVPQFATEAEAYFSRWGDSGVVDLKQEFSTLVALTAARTLLGREIREQLFDQVADLLHDLDDGMRPISVFFPYLPTAFHKKRDEARVKMGQIFAKVIQARRASPVKEEDVLQQFCDARYQNVEGGRQLTEEEITGLLIAVLFAGQHTSSITSAWTGIFMINSKDKDLAAAVQEQSEIMARHGPGLDMDVLGEMDVLHRNITEALRLHPPLLLVMRYAKQGFSVTTAKGQTYNVPAGDIVAASPNFAHVLPSVFDRPLAYEPDRFAAPREEDKKKPFSFIGFGGGRHACIGQNFAYLQIKAIWSVLLRSFDFELLDPVPDADYDSMVIGPKACRVKYTRRKLQPARA
ncbi:sterol 14 desaturase [Raphidocelis subcapitata]|uniref:Sterol 14 desaturase n=1 Tax=Raphidocelis subcapitata TaxID=307507 RepID=A0A2V0NLC5_9CHLO|nr:sterol 14 desaturase [Raphidocelis subcapitata]|eukprot:GBF88206.1 sterol 14 desaturase [Raphidocelis subcapitata]